MKKIVVINGIIAGVIVSGLMLISFPLVDRGVISYDNGVLVGYASMILAFSMIFVGIKAYRDQVGRGFISFLQGCKIGLLITLIASLMYAVTWDIYYRTSEQDFMQKYATHYIEKMELEGASAEEIRSMRAQMADSTEMYQNTFIRFGITLMEILPVGVLLTLVAAAILRRKDAGSGVP